MLGTRWSSTFLVVTLENEASFKPLVNLVNMSWHVICIIKQIMLTAHSVQMSEYKRHCYLHLKCDQISSFASLFVVLKLPKTRKILINSALNFQYFVDVTVFCHTSIMLHLVFGKTKWFRFCFWFWAAIMSPGRWSRSDWDSGRRLLPGRGSCRLGKET